MKNRKLPIIFIIITLMLDAMGIGLIVPVMPDLLKEVSGAEFARAALWGGLLSTVFAVMQFFFGPLLGNLSDRYGRRPVLLVSLAIMAADYVVLAVADSIWILLIARVVGGITAATAATANAYIADISKPEEKSANFGLVGAAFGIGFVLGPTLGGLLGDIGTRVPFYVAAGIATLNLIYGIFVLPETVTDRIRRPFVLKNADPFSSFREIGKFQGLKKLLVFSFLLEFAFMVYPAVWSFFGKIQFGWEPRMIGFSLAAYGISMAIVQAGLIRAFVPRFGESRCIQFGLVIEMAGFLMLAFVTSGTLAFLIIPFTALGAVITPSLQGIMSKATDDDKQGELQGVITSARSLAAIGAPLVMTKIFDHFAAENATPFLPGAPFLLSMILMAVCFVVFRSHVKSQGLPTS